MSAGQVSLARTEAALAAYDAHWGDNYDPYQEDPLAVAVGEAFGLDTADWNNPETCRTCVRPGLRTPRPGWPLSFVRRMVRSCETNL